MRTSRTPLRACLAALVAAAALLTAGAGTARAADPPLRDLAAAKGRVMDNGSVPDGGSVTLGFNTSWSGSNPVPTVSLG
ncbi:hypothetical protein [Streptomyces sp. NPDC090057]|uniref:hypothetical protein n=1 Tax=Streptomyces sp. NPDC090057 TaxID=3365935 RepID=UPI00381F7C58